MTLVELILGIAMFVIVAGTVSALVAPITNVFIKANEIAEVNTLLDNIANQILSDFRYAVDDIDDDSLDVIIDRSNTAEKLVISMQTHIVTYTVDGSGILMRNGFPVFSKDFYKRRSVRIECSLANGAVEGTAYVLTVTIINDRDGGIMSSRQYAVKPLVLNQHND
jgi:type II secretory pathway pseudopilin PulG